jgi:Asp/Glu/hydantoin racemase
VTIRGDVPDRLVTLIHATPAAVPPVERAVRALPGLRTANLLDESLLTEAERRGGVDATCVARMRTLVTLARAAGSDGVLVTCNIYSSAVEQLAKEMAPYPLISVDEPMIREAVRMGPRVGVLATVAAGLAQQSTQLEAEAARRDMPVQLETVLLDGAFDALVSGDGGTHDEIVVAALRLLRPCVDVVVLAQASMARVLDVLTDAQTHGGATPVLASPQLAAAELQRLMSARAATG